MPSSPVRAAEDQGPSLAPDALSSTQQNQPKSCAEDHTAQSARHTRLECDEKLDDADWHSRAWAAFAYGPSASLSPPSSQASTVWGWPVDN